MSNLPVTAEDLYIYAMGLLDEQEHTRLTEFLQQSPEARAELVNVRGDIALLALTVDAETPSPMARQRFLKQVSRERRTPLSETAPLQAAPAEQLPIAPMPVAIPIATSEHLTPIQPDSYTSHKDPLPFRSSYAENDKARRGFVRTVSPWLGWAIAAGLAVTTYDFYRKTETLTVQVASAQESSALATANSAKAQAVLETLRSGSAQHFLLTRLNTQAVPSARITYLAKNGALVMQGTDMEQLPPYKTYELWLIPDGENAKPIAAGTFKPDERGFASLILPELPKGIVAGKFGVTLEDDGGSQTPTLPLLMIGSS